jgi:hypothetical protein
MTFNDEAGVKWHRTSEGHIWHKLRKEMNCNYLRFAKTKVPENATCGICGEPAEMKTLRVKGKRVPIWYVVDNKEKLTVRCK